MHKHCIRRPTENFQIRITLRVIKDELTSLASPCLLPECRWVPPPTNPLCVSTQVRDTCPSAFLYQKPRSWPPPFRC